LLISFREAQLEDFDYCAKLYITEWEQLARGNLMEPPFLLEILRRWDANQVRIITGEGRDIGWLQCSGKTP
jgi:hypothetical protein